MEHSDMLDDVSNEVDVLREEMAEEEYAALNEGIDEYLSDIMDNYSPPVHCEYNSDLKNLEST